MHGCVPEREIDRQKERGFRRIYTQYNIIYTFCIIHPPKKKNIDTLDTLPKKKNTTNKKKSQNITERIDITFGRMSLLRRSCS